MNAEWYGSSVIKTFPLDPVSKFALASSECPGRFKEAPGQDWRANQPAGEEGAGGVAEEAAESLRWCTSQCLSGAVGEMVHTVLMSHTSVIAMGCFVMNFHLLL